ncbi:MAG: glycosyltransferase [Sphaerochaetaceae bacterium]|nr:glycosyltransferase [Sphaerochaetaceae bacterium]
MADSVAIPLTIGLFFLNLFMFAFTFLVRWGKERRKTKRLQFESKLEQQIINEEIDIDSIDPQELFPIYKKLREHIELPSSQEAHMRELLLNSGLCTSQLKQLKSHFYVRRAQAAANLKYLESKIVREALLEALLKENHPVVIIQLAHALSLQKVKKSIGGIVSKLRKSNHWIRKRLTAILHTFGDDFKRYAVRHLGNRRSYMRNLICSFALYYPVKESKSYLVSIASEKRTAGKAYALAALLKHFPKELLEQSFLDSTNRLTLAHVVQALATTPQENQIRRILYYAKYKALHGIIVQCLSEITTNDPSTLLEIRSLFIQCNVKRNREILAKVLENRIEHYLSRINGNDKDNIVQLINELIKAHHTSAMLFFLNRNKDPDIEKTLIKVLKTATIHQPYLRAEIKYYLDKRLQQSFGFSTKIKVTETPKLHSEPPKRLQLAIILIALLLFFPIVVLASEFSSLVSLTWSEIGRLYIVRFNYLLMFYSIIINVIYLSVLAVSIHGARVQARLWETKDYRFLFTKGMLPSISIIAPAYNEMVNIVESTNSLLNQYYPDFELIVVNDGSKDDTLNTLINYYNLEKRDMFVRRRLHTRQLRGIYTNKDIPNLIVVDKMNGGKADSLNMGLNIASKEFFCGIDADSLLESNALLKAVSTMIDAPVECVAAGGNICPANGCTVEHGYLEHIALPKKFLARLQSLEYTRAFMAGRVGWAHMNLLLIISGAFGIFNRERTIRTGGYLTKSGRYRKDTVGEDMELVVRLSRYMREMKLPYSVDYAFNANCWTEVPETMKILHRQRDRWHRGLIDILLFHRRIIANPRYGRLGMVSMLYYFLFELIGPFIETQGLMMVAVAAIVGLLDLPLALLLFSTTILLGVLVSISSVYVADMDRNIYGTRDVFKLLTMAVIENFGVRQLISFWRVSGFFSAMKKGKGWGAQVRKGFGPSIPPTTVTAKERKKKT